MLKDLPRYECLLEAAKEFPDLDPSAAEAFLHLLRTSDEAFGATERTLAGHNISQGRFGVLMLLWRGCRAAEIENAAGAPSPLHPNATSEQDEEPGGEHGGRAAHRKGRPSESERPVSAIYGCGAQPRYPRRSRTNVQKRNTPPHSNGR